MRTGVYGGTFNPIHKGHLHILTEFARRLSLDRVLVIPTKIPPHKRAEALASPEDRLEMCRLAVEGLPLRAQVSDLELRREEKSYTVLTLRELEKEFPGEEFYLLMGEDMFLTVQDWFEAEEIFRRAVICASPRSEEGLRRMQEHALRLETQFQPFRWVLEDIPYLPASSTEIRQTGDLSAVPEPVAAYIREKNLYGRNSRKEGSR